MQPGTLRIVVERVFYPAYGAGVVAKFPGIDGHQHTMTREEALDLRNRLTDVLSLFGGYSCMLCTVEMCSGKEFDMHMAWHRGEVPKEIAEAVTGV